MTKKTKISHFTLESVKIAETGVKLPLNAKKGIINSICYA